MRVQDLDHDELKDYWLSVQQRIQRLQAHSDEIQALIKTSAGGDDARRTQSIAPVTIAPSLRFGEI